jgi:DNA polymerase-3 subunit alpha
LTEVLDTYCEKLTINIPIENLKEDTILNLETILKNNPGKKSLKFTIWDEIENIEVNLPSRNTKIDVSSSLLDILQKQQINYKLN